MQPAMGGRQAANQGDGQQQCSCYCLKDSATLHPRPCVPTSTPAQRFLCAVESLETAQGSSSAATACQVPCEKAPGHARGLRLNVATASHRTQGARASRASSTPAGIPPAQSCRSGQRRSWVSSIVSGRWLPSGAPSRPLCAVFSDVTSQARQPQSHKVPKTLLDPARDSATFQGQQEGEGAARPAKHFQEEHGLPRHQEPRDLPKPAPLPQRTSGSGSHSEHTAARKGKARAAEHTGR